jgi:perosamine synthetase
VTDADIEAVASALRAGQVSGSAPLVEEFEHAFAAYCGRKHGIAVNSGTAALQIAVAALGIGEDDEVLVSAMTNAGTALACYHRGAVPVPVDSDATWNLDVSLLERLTTAKTRAIMPVHLFGRPADINAVLRFAAKHKLHVIEDAAEAHGAEIRGRRCGSFGDISCFSFYANKVISTGEGGMALTDDDSLAAEMRKLRNMYHGERRFVHEQAGHSFRMPGYNAALGLSQLKRIEQTIARKRELASWYSEELNGVRGLQLPSEDAGTRNVYWMYAISVQPGFGCSRDELMRNLAEKGIETRTFFCPMNQQPFLKRMSGWRDIAYPVADSLWQTGLYLPSSLSLTRAQVREICDTIKQAQR